MATILLRQRKCIGADHPCLPGHFPGAPVLPGVLLLEWLAIALQAGLGLRLQRIGQVKYLRPWLPERDVELSLLDLGGRIGFELTDAGQVLARGQVEARA